MKRSAGSRVEDTKNGGSNCLLPPFLCDAYRIQTYDLLIRSQSLYSAELRRQVLPVYPADIKRTQFRTVRKNLISIKLKDREPDLFGSQTYIWKADDWLLKLSFWNFNIVLGCAFCLSDTCLLAGQVAEIENTCAANFADFVDLNLVNERRLVREYPLYAYSIGYLADGECPGERG